MELFIQNFIDMFVDMSFYIMLGLLLVGILNTFVKKEQMMKHLGRREFSSVVKASMIGVPLPLCSCGVVPTAVGLKKSGASNGAVVSFLISTPQTGVDSILATYSMMGMGMAVFRPLAAFFSGIIGGGIVNTLTKNDEEIVVGEVSTACGCSTSEVIEETSCGDSGKKETEETSCCCDNSEEAHELSFVRKIKRVFTYAYGEFLDEIAMHFIIGILIGTTITTFVPTNFFVNIGINQGILSMLSMVIIGLPMYICSTASIPIAISFLTKGLSLGSVFVFLFTGPVTNMASIMVLKKSLGTKITRLYIGLVITCAVVFGYVLDYVVGVIPLEILESHAHMGHGHGTSLTQSILALVLCILMIRSIVGVRYLKKC
ncbi:MAG: SO_0444 family Cu/Zn efflux transporter [Eubacteriales bacterium]